LFKRHYVFFLLLPKFSVLRVFKFGGASVKDADAVRNVASIIEQHDGQLAVVVSAMGKTTNAMELIVDALFNRKQEVFEELVAEREAFHKAILKQLFEENDPIYEEIEGLFSELREKYEERLPENYDFEYDQVVSYGELISTKTISAYLNKSGVSAKWMDARELIRTDRNYREADVDWKRTEELFKERFIPGFQRARVLVTQGFIGHTPEGFTTTLGREGSDFTGGIIAYSCGAESLTIWKDVPGMLNADPKYFDNTIKLDRISFREAIELAYYGASVIHPKTVQPLQNRAIPLYVNSFLDPSKEGTVIQTDTTSDHLIPSFIFKMDQVLVSITPKDFSFIVEKNLSDIFERMAGVKAKINIMQNSALNFSVLLDQKKINLQALIDSFSNDYHVKYNEGLELITIRHYDQETIDRVTKNKQVLLEQKTRDTVRIVVKDIA
jgi:aspartate kinase